ncbi:MAG: PEP-CTERM sorting domain-containing protein [Desulfobacula sp.]|nr:PEP-CTERM sorting domain-containing protein [Desulfobacula sp.]
MKKIIVFLCFSLTMLFTIGTASAFFIDFEDGSEANPVNDIAGVTFEDFNGYNPIYGDTRTGNWNTHSDEYNSGGGSYHHNGWLWIFAGVNADARGVKVDFTNNDGTWFQTGYASYSTFHVEAYLTDGSVISVSGAANTGSPMSFLRVDATYGLFIDYVVLHDTGNYWIADDMSGDTSGIDPVPEPATMLLFGLGLLGLAGASRRKK